MTQQEDHIENPPGLAWCAPHAFAGGAFYGLADGASVLMSESLDLTSGQEALLMFSDAIALGLLCMVLLTPTQWLIGRIRPGLLIHPAWTLFLLGLALSGTFDLAEHWFTDPPPHTEAPPLHGNLPVFVGIAAALATTSILLGRMVPAGKHRFWTIMAICGALMIWAQSSPRVLVPMGDPPGNAPNVLLVTLDTTRADHFGAYGNERVRTPNFDAFADSGARFDQAMAQIPVTGPSHTTIMSGQGPWTHGGLLNGIPVPANVPLLAETMRTNGYRTGGFVSAYVLERSVGLDRGFQVYDDDFGLLKGWARTLPGKLMAGVGRHIEPTHVLERKGERTVDQALEWMKDQPDPSMGIPFFAWVHLFDPHGPYTPPAPWDTRYYEGDPRDPDHTSMESVVGVAEYLKPSIEGITDVQWVLDQYAGEISYTDAQFGRLLDWLEDNGLANNTLVIVVGDHGESLGEHDSWFNHGDDLYEPSSHVPLAIRMPGTIPAGTVVEDPVELTDLVPTIHELLGIAIPELSDGSSLVSSMFGGAVRPVPMARSICFDREANIEGREQGLIDRPTWRMVAIRTATGRYVEREAEGFAPALYRHDSDPDEAEPIQPEGAENDFLHAQAQAVLEGMSAEDLERSSTELDDATRESLEALGYMD
jgi:arylsulfatase A-like enzyme